MNNDFNYSQSSTDASHQFRPSSAGGGLETATAARSGNLADLTKNSTVYRITTPVPGSFFYPEYSVAGLASRRS